jgi:glucose/arabinose dehydrogenase
MLARFRSVGDRFAERAVLLDRIPASPRGPGGTVRMGSDGDLYIGLDDSGNGRVAPSLGSYNGKILRMTPQATTPDDQAGATPVYSVDHPLPKAVDWQPSSGELWVVDGLENASARLSAFVAENARQKRASMRARYDLPAGTGASSAAFYRSNVIPIFRDNLFIAAETGRHLIRVRFDPQNPERVVSVERLLQDQIGALRVVAEGLDGGLYLCNQTQLWRLVL